VTKAIDTYALACRMRRPLPILPPNPKNLNAYAPEDIPKPIDVEICPSCNSSHCKCHKHRSPED
jgi:hypothetical protein